MSTPLLRTCTGSDSGSPLSPSSKLQLAPAPGTTSYLNNASDVLSASVDSSATELLRNEQLCHVATALCPFLITNGNCDDPDENGENTTAHQRCLETRTLAGGLSNALFVVSSPSRSVLVRIHPDTGMILDHDEENRIVAWLSRLGKAPLFYGRFRNGRVEEYYQGYNPLSCHDMPKYATRIAAMMADLHALSVPANVLPSVAIGRVWSLVEEWFQRSLSGEHQQGPTQMPLDVNYMYQQWRWLRTQLSATSNLPGIAFARQLVFTHMDGQSLNILRNSKTGDMKLIDFEYSAMNSRAADIANTFCEYCDMNNLNGKWDAEYPSEAQQLEFLDAYLKCSGMEDLDDASRRQFRDEVNKHTLISHMGWAMWGIQQSFISNIEFEYLTYAQHRLDGYHHFKAMFWPDDM